MTRSKPPAFQFYARDWLADAAVLAMSCAARGAYINLLAVCWMEGSLPADPVTLRRLAGAELEEWDAISETVLARFALENGAYRHHRLDSERSKQRTFSKLQSDRRGHRMSTGMQPDVHRNATGPLPKGHSASASASAVRTQTRAPSLVQSTRHLAFAGRIQVPAFLHQEFVAGLGGDMADDRLRVWYVALNAEVEASEEIITSQVGFLRGRFQQWAAGLRAAVDEVPMAPRLAVCPDCGRRNPVGEACRCAFARDAATDLIAGTSLDPCRTGRPS